MLFLAEFLAGLVFGLAASLAEDQGIKVKTHWWE